MEAVEALEAEEENKRLGALMEEVCSLRKLTST